MYQFGKLFTYDYIDNDSSYIGGSIEYCNAVLLIDFNASFIKGMKFSTILFDTNRAIITLIEKKGTDFTINSIC